MPRLTYIPRRVIDINGISDGATVYVYQSGTTTLVNLYSDVAGTIPLANPYTVAVGALIPPIYYTYSGDVRVKVVSVSGNIDDQDPYPSYVLTTDLSSLVPTAVATRAVMAALTNPIAGQTRYLLEAGRQGIFKFDNSNLSSFVSADTAQGIYVAPSSAPTGASGAWVRQYAGPLNIKWFGAVADCTAPGVGTDNAPAINSAINVASLISKSASILVPKTSALGYRVASTLVFTSGVKLQGEGFHENPGIVNGVNYPIPQNYRGSILTFDQNVAGIQFIAATDNLANAVVLEFESSMFSVIEDIMLYGGGGTVLTPNGIEIRSVVHARNVRVENFAGSGFKIDAFTAGANNYGLADCSNLTRCISRFNKLHGFHIRGNDSNVIHFNSCDSSNNGGAGYLDEGFLGNTYTSCHAATNNQSNGAGTIWTTQVQTDSSALTASDAGSYITTSGVAAHVFTGCYAETGAGLKHQIMLPSILVGGNLASSGSATAASTAMIFRGDGNIKAPNITLTGGGSWSHGGAGAVDIINSAGGTALSRWMPGSGTFSNVQLMGNGNSVALGLDILAGVQQVSFSSDTFTFRNAAQTTNYWVADNTGFKVSTGALKIGAVTVMNSSGVLQAASFPILTGDVTTPGASLAATIANNAVTYAKMQDVTATARLIGRMTAGSGDPEEIPVAGGLGFTAGTNLTINGAINAATSVAIAGAITSSSATAGVGYATGAGGTVTQITSKSTGVTLNKTTGQITMNNAALAAGAKVSFAVSNTSCAATDIPVVAVVSGGTANAYRADVTAVAANTFTITVENITAGSLSEAPVIGFSIIKGVTA